ncbi:MAG TPA: DUF488 domain-containing protein [Gammaproteobacteria bacterium]|nr:DUF488 domain-containing protein [Gammaproteobacteria bacterium]
MTLKIKRIYEKFQESDGFRILIDRLWPRGIKKENAHIDLWLKEIAPSDALRKWFNHDPQKWPEFQKRYAKELKSKGEVIAIIYQEEQKHTVTLLYGSKETEHNNAIALKKFLEG